MTIADPARALLQSLSGNTYALAVTVHLIQRGAGIGRCLLAASPLR